MRLKMGAVRSSCPLPPHPTPGPLEVALKRDLEAWKVAKAAVARARGRKR
jgi:hypothetical protein